MRIKSANLYFSKNEGLAQIPLMIVLLLMAVAIPVATSLVKRSQDIRNRAAYEETRTAQVAVLPGIYVPVDVKVTENPDGSKTVEFVDKSGSAPRTVGTATVTSSGDIPSVTDSSGNKIDIAGDIKGPFPGGSNADVEFIQSVLANPEFGQEQVLASGLGGSDGIDGLAGPNTRNALRNVIAQVNFDTTQPSYGSSGGTIPTGYGDQIVTFDESGNIAAPIGGGGPTIVPYCIRKCATAIRGDANCDKKIDIYDIAIWRSEFKDQNGDTVKKKDWNADFNCDGLVDLKDQSIWLKNY